MPADSLAAFQSNRGAAVEDHRPGLRVDHHADHLAEPEVRRVQTEDEGNGKPVPVHLSLCMAREVFQPRRLPETMMARSTSLGSLCGRASATKYRFNRRQCFSSKCQETCE